MKKIIACALLVCVSITSGCATMFNKTTQDIAINASQANAQVMIKNKAGETVYDGIAPANLNLKKSAGFFRGEKYTIEGTKEGYGTYITNVNSSLSAWLFANLLFSLYIAPVAVVIDGATGGMYNLKPDKVMLQFSKPENE